MVFFSSKHRVKNLSVVTKLWAYPVAYTLKAISQAVVKCVDKFDETLTMEMILNKEGK